MTDMPAAYREQLARIDRQREDARRFAAVVHKLMAEDNKPTSGRFLTSVAVFAVILSGIAIFLAAGAPFMQNWGGR